MKKAAAFLSLAVILFLSACSAQSTSTATSLPPATNPPTAVPPTSAPASSTEPAATEPPSSAPSAEAASPTPEGACTDIASFVADVTIPDYTHLELKEAFKKVWRVKNTGTCTWTSDYKAVYSHGNALGAPLSIPLAETAPGDVIDISADMLAPNSDGKFEIFYRLTNATGDPMPIDAGDSLWALITVGKVVAYPPATPTAGGSTVTVSGGASSGPGLTDAGCVYQANADFISQTFALINAARAANGLPALVLNEQLNVAAQSHSADMACNSFLDHNGWNGSTPDSRIAAAGYAASITRENIYAQPPQYGGTPQTAVDWWMGDQIHRDAILNPQVKDIGIGYAAYSRSTLGGYFTVDFGAP
jgi:uncharacterized protein YkwD